MARMPPSFNEPLSPPPQDNRIWRFCPYFEANLPEIQYKCREWMRENAKSFPAAEFSKTLHSIVLKRFKRRKNFSTDDAWILATHKEFILAFYHVCAEFDLEAAQYEISERTRCFSKS